MSGSPLAARCGRVGCAVLGVHRLICALLNVLAAVQQTCSGAARAWVDGGLVATVFFALGGLLVLWPGWILTRLGITGTRAEGAPLLEHLVTLAIAGAALLASLQPLVTCVTFPVTSPYPGRAGHVGAEALALGLGVLAVLGARRLARACCAPAGTGG